MAKKWLQKVSNGLKQDCADYAENGKWSACPVLYTWGLEIFPRVAKSLQSATIFAQSLQMHLVKIGKKMLNVKASRTPMVAGPPLFMWKMFMSNNNPTAELQANKTTKKSIDVLFKSMKIGPKKWKGVLWEEVKKAPQSLMKRFLASF